MKLTVIGMKTHRLLHVVCLHDVFVVVCEYLLLLLRSYIGAVTMP